MSVILTQYFQRKKGLLKVAKSHKVFHFGSNLQKRVPIQDPEHLLFSDQVRDLTSFFEDLGQSEKPSEIKSPLFSYIQLSTLVNN